MKHVLFDTDGVIVHPTMWSQEYARRSGILSESMKPFFQGIFADCILGKADLKEAIAPYLDEWKWTETVDEYLREWFVYEHRIDMRVIETVGKLRAKWIACHVATNQEKYRLAYLRDEMGFSRYFDSIFCSCEIGYRKPDGEFYSYILKELDITNPSEITYFDDSDENVLSAKKIGIGAVLYRDFSDLETFLGKI